MRAPFPQLTAVIKLFHPWFVSIFRCRHCALEFVMARVDQADGSNGRRRTTSRLVLQNFAPLRRRLLCAVPLAALPAAMVGPGSAFAQSCTGLCAAQTADQINLLSAFSTLELTRGTGLAQCEPQDRRNYLSQFDAGPEGRDGGGRAASVRPDQYSDYCVPDESEFLLHAGRYSDSDGLPSSVTTAVSSIFGNVGLGLKDAFGQPGNIYGNAYNNLSADPNKATRGRSRCRP